MEVGGDCGVGDFDGELVRIELFADPLDLFGAFGMRRISQNVEQVLITPSPAAILWWTVALSADAGRITRSGDRACQSMPCQGLTQSCVRRSRSGVMI